jgi:transcriptional regulator with AAA-type ATPase domain/pSer/pThr/pTyr-binding forkhead associated (FHA) protein
MLRLVAYAPNGVERFAVDRAEMLIGSGEDCDIRLPYAGVGSRHARLSAADGTVRIEDLGSRKGMVVNGERVRRARLQVLDEVRLGSIALLLEDVVHEESPAAEPDAEPVAAEPTITPARMLEHLAKVSEWVLSDSMSSTTLESLILELLNAFGGGVLFLFQGLADQRGIKFVVASDARWLAHGSELLRQITDSATETGEITVQGGATATKVGRLGGQPAWIAFRSLRALDRPYQFVLALPRFRPGAWSPLPALRTLVDQLILGLVHHVGQYEPIIFGSPRRAALTLAPGLTAGESRAMRRVLDQLRELVDQPIHVLLRGEPGTSKELLARSLHLSGSRRDGPFVVADCGGVKPHQLEADLFGAEVAGKRETLERQGKLLEADGGTLYLRDVEILPLPLQDRLVRFLRSGEVEPVDSLRSQRVDVRLVATAGGPLETWAARDKFRIDLAYRLSQFAIDVPPLRQRREDLPLLIQAALNRVCHKIGKRVQGITVQALEALAVHDYPGNLPELENIVRRLVFLCPAGQPIGQSMLPEEVRLSKITGPRPEATSELNLEKLVSECERAAIREALRRSEGNKSEAARQLGLSRNGLAMKIARLGLQ